MLVCVRGEKTCVPSMTPCVTPTEPCILLLGFSTELMMRGVAQYKALENIIVIIGANFIGGQMISLNVFTC